MPASGSSSSGMGIPVGCGGRVVPPAEPVPGRDLAPEQLVDRDPEAGRELEQRLEREAALAALGLRDRARRDAGQTGEVGLARARAGGGTARSASPRRAAAGAALELGRPPFPDRHR